MILSCQELRGAGHIFKYEEPIKKKSAKVY